MEIRKFAQWQKPQAQVQQAQTQQTQKQLPIEEMTPGIEINELVVMINSKFFILNKLISKFLEIKNPLKWVGFL